VACEMVKPTYCAKCPFVFEYNLHICFHLYGNEMKTSKPFGEISSRVCFQSKCAGSAEWGDVRRHDAGRQMPDAAMSRGG